MPDSVITCLCDIYMWLCHYGLKFSVSQIKFFTNAPSVLASDHTPLSFFLWLSSLPPRLKRLKLLLIPLFSLIFVSNQSQILLGSTSLICLCCSIPTALIPPLDPSSTSASIFTFWHFSCVDTLLPSFFHTIARSVFSEQILITLFPYLKPLWHFPFLP